VPDGSTSTIAVKDRQQNNNGVVICTKIQQSLNKNLSEVAILSRTAGVDFPGALVLAEQNLSEGRPTPIALPHGPAILSVDLPGLENPSGTLVPAGSAVQQFLSAKLEEWDKQAVSQGYINAARSFIQTTQAFTSKQVSLDLGFNSKRASGSASAQISSSSTTETSDVVAYFKQVLHGLDGCPVIPVRRVRRPCFARRRAAGLCRQPPAGIRAQHRLRADPDGLNGNLGR
jgi:thiol-activated cytolysin